MSFQMIQAVIKCFERSIVDKIEENLNDVSYRLLIRLVVAANEAYVEDVFVPLRKYCRGIVYMSY